jgi:formamidopyrimidine-DNA glycosylase
MPELPDLQVFAANLTKAIKGKKVQQVLIPVTKKINAPVAAFKKAIEQQHIKTVTRQGKQLHITLGNHTVLGLHLMLHGKLHLLQNLNEQHRNTILVLHFDDGSCLALTDPFKSAVVTLNPDAATVPDALSARVNATFLKGALQTRKNIKTLLMDQKIIQGIGNAYADEILWHARIAPQSISNKIPYNRIKALAKSIKQVLKDAEKQIRKKHPQIIAGEIRDFLAVHVPGKKETAGGVPIQQTTIASRKTYYTHEQELFQ